MNLNQVTVPSGDVKQSIAFYQTLGLQLIVKADHYARFELPAGDSTFSIHYVENPTGSETVVYFEVDDLVSTVAELKSRGVEFTREPTQERWLWHEARLRDPAGNELCIFTAGENRKNPPWRLPST